MRNAIEWNHLTPRLALTSFRTTGPWSIYGLMTKGRKSLKDSQRLHQGGKRLGDETSSPHFKRCVMRRRTGTSALSALPVRLVAGKIYLSTNRKSHFLSLFFSQPCTMIKTFFHSPGSQLKCLCLRGH